MDSLKEFLTPKSFNKFSFVGIIFWILFGVTLFGIFADTESYEPRFDFNCGVKTNNLKDLIEGRCFEQYEERYNKLGIPVYGFVIFNFLIIAIVSVIYSLSVKSRVNELEAPVVDAERGQDQQENRRGQKRTPPRGLFIRYVSQLAFRISFGILFIVLQTQVLYVSNFPSNFKCELVPTAGNNSVTPSTNITPVTQVFYCHNTRASKKTFWINVISVVNGIFVCLVFIELLLILSRARKWGEKFMEDEQFFADHLKAKSPSPELQAFIQSMKNRVKKGTEQPADLKQPINRPSPGECPKPKDLDMDQIYTKLKIQEGRAEYNFPTDRWEQLRVYPPNENIPEFTRPEDIIDATHKNILVVGRPGIGKTLFCTKLLRDWATDNLEKHYDVAFFLKFRRFSERTELNLRELLCASEYPTNLNDEVWEYIRQNPNQVLLVFDGVDEFSANSEISKVHKNTTEEEKMPLHALYNKIANRELLDGATLITTTRPTAVSCVKRLNFNRTVEILGFTSERVEDYVEKFTKADHDRDHDADGAKETIWQHISTILNLFSLSYIPVNLFIICSCLFYVLRTCGPSRLPTKLTEIYSIAIKIFFCRHNEQYRYSETDCDQFVFKQFHELPSRVQDVFERLGKIAFEGIEKGKLIFGPREVEGLEDCGLLHRLPDRAGPSPFAPREQQFCFTHLTVQEFMAAKHLTDTLNDEELRTFVSDKIRDGKWAVVTQFIAGLLQEREVPLTHIFTDLLPAKTLRRERRKRTDPPLG